MNRKHKVFGGPIRPDELNATAQAELRSATCPRCGLDTVVWDDDPGCDACGLIMGDSDPEPVYFPPPRQPGHPHRLAEEWGWTR